MFSSVFDRLSWRYFNTPGLWLLLMVCLIGQPLQADAASRVSIVVGSPSMLSNEFVEQFRTELKSQGGNGLEVNLLKFEELPKYRPKSPSDELILAVGVQALAEISQLKLDVPVLGVFVPQISYDAILADHPRSPGKISAVLLDQPFSRQLALLKTILPDAQKVGVLYGQTSQQFSDSLHRASRLLGLELVEAEVGQEKDVMSALKQVLDESRVLLAVPDASVYSRETAQTILLTTYRYQTPVIGFSQAYVRAGALAAVYSSPRQIARQVAEIVLMQNGSLPAPVYPKYFSIDINRQVARSLGITLNGEHELSEALSRIERQSP